MAKKLVQFVLPIQILYFYDARNTLRSRKADYQGHAKTIHGAKRAAYKHLDKDYGDAHKAIIIDLRTGLEVWHMHTAASGSILITVPDEVKTNKAVAKDIQQMEAEGKRF